jgi:hypothetical protein
MIEYLKDIFPRIIRYSKKLDDLTVLTEKPWKLIDEESQIKEVWIFCQNKDLIISKNGIAQEGTWKYAANSIFIKVGEFQRLINQAFIDDVVLLLRLDGGNEFIALANEQKIDKSFKIEKYLNDKYRTIQIESNYPEVLPKPSKVTPPPLSLEDQIKMQKWDTYHTKISFIFLIVLAIIISPILLAIGVNNKSLYSLFIIPALILLVSMIILLPIYLNSRKELKSLLEKKNKLDDTQLSNK